VAVAIIVRNADGELGRCDGKCYDAPPHTRCVCVCGGANHGVGRLDAMASAERIAERWTGTHATCELHPEARQEVFRF